MSDAADALLEVLGEHIGKPVLAFGDPASAAVLGGFRELREPPSRCYSFQIDRNPWYGLRRARRMARQVDAPLTVVNVPSARAGADVKRVMDVAGSADREAVQLAHVLMHIAPRAARDGHDWLVSPVGHSGVLDHVGWAFGAEVSVPWQEAPLREHECDPVELAQELDMPGPYAAQPVASSGLRALHQRLLAQPLNRTRARTLPDFYRDLASANGVASSERITV
jgi:hypothetical protein